MNDSDEGLPLVQQAGRGIGGCYGGDGEIAVRVDVGHSCRLLDPVLLIVLNDAERINPQLAASKSLR
jgi:hypothetical protein